MSRRRKGGSRSRSVALAAAGALMVAARPVGAATTVFQQGVSPAREYDGCVDTSIEGQGWKTEEPRDRPKRQILTGYGARSALVRFDLSAIGEGRYVHRALLRFSFAEVPSDRKQEVEVYAPAREWDESATWFEYKYLDGKKSEANNWTKPGGDVDETDFGKGKPGLVDRASCRGGPFGHIVELDVTPLVKAWVSGERPNYGFLVRKSRGSFRVASSEWPMPGYRPALAVEHYREGERPTKDAQLRLPPEPGPSPPLSEIAATPGGAVRGRSSITVRFGKNSNCRYRTGHMAGYAKQDIRYPGNWGWTPRIRVGGTGGDLNHAAFYFDLSSIPRRAAIRRATFRAFADVGNMRVPPSIMGQAPEPSEKEKKKRIRNCLGRARNLMGYSFGLFRVKGERTGPGWKGDEFTFAERRRGGAWAKKGGGLVDSTASAPAAVCNVGELWQDVVKGSDAGKEMPETWLEWDVTGLVRAWVARKAPNCGMVMDARLMGGETVLFSDDWPAPDRRPYLEVELAARMPKADSEPVAAPISLAGDYWVESMKKVHASWKGTRGTFAQYGDSITVTMAFWTPLMYGERKGISAETAEALATARKYVHRDSWRAWKGAKWGNTGNTTVSWGFDNIDEWQKRMNPEVAVVMWGTNDAYLGPRVPIYTEKYAAVVDRILADGTVPIITTLPPRYTQRLSVEGFLTVWDFRQATMFIARARKVPLIDLWGEMVSRRPGDWDGKLEKFNEYKGYDCPTMMARDGIHPSNPKKYRGDWTEEGLSCGGFNLRNYLTLRKWHEVYGKVLARSKD